MKIIKITFFQLAILFLQAAPVPESVLDGYWSFDYSEQNGKRLANPTQDRGYAHFEQGTFKFSPGGLSSNGSKFDVGVYSINVQNKIKEIDIISEFDDEKLQKVRMYGIFEIDGSKLKLAFSERGQPRPKDFSPDVKVEYWKRIMPSNRPIGGPKL